MAASGVRKVVVGAVAGLALVGAPLGVADEVDLGPVAVGEDSHYEPYERGMYAAFELDVASGADTFVDVYAYIGDGGDAWVDAFRYSCLDEPGHYHCEIEGYYGGVADGDVTVDLEAGTGSIVTTLGECAIDAHVTADGPTETAGYPESPIPTPGVRDDRVELRYRSHEERFAGGSASGSVCTWLDDAAVVDSYGAVYELGERTRSFYVRPDLDEA